MADPFDALVAWRADADLLPEEREWCSDATLRRYSAARPKDYSAALAMLKATLAWRRTAVVGPLHCPKCDVRRTSHCFVPIGTADASVFVYGCPARASDPDVEGTVRHVVHCLEHAFAAHGCETWTWLVDFKGFGFSHAMQARLGIAFARIFAEHFPERLRRIFLINTPVVFSLLLSAIEPFADARTMSKIVRVAGSPTEVADALEAGGVPAAQAAWMRNVLGMDAAPGALPPLPSGAGALTPRVAASPTPVDTWPEEGEAPPASAAAAATR